MRSSCCCRSRVAGCRLWVVDVGCGCWHVLSHIKLGRHQWLLGGLTSYYRHVIGSVGWDVWTVDMSKFPTSWSGTDWWMKPWKCIWSQGCRCSSYESSSTCYGKSIHVRILLGHLKLEGRFSTTSVIDQHGTFDPEGSNGDKVRCTVYVWAW